MISIFHLCIIPLKLPNNGSEIVIGDESNLNYNVDVSLQSFEGNFRGKCSKTMTVI
jgi:hypothetical protein